MNIDYQAIADQTGLHFDNATDLLYYLQSRISYLGLHNRNLTKEQYYAVCDIENILNNITEE